MGPVSQICALIVFPSTLMLRVANSTPIVLFDSRLNSFRVNLDNRFDLPTPESPISTTAHATRGSHMAGSICQLIMTTVRLPALSICDNAQARVIAAEPNRTKQTSVCQTGAIADKHSQKTPLKR